MIFFTMSNLNFNRKSVSNYYCKYGMLSFSFFLFFFFFFYVNGIDTKMHKRISDGTLSSITEEIQRCQKDVEDVIETESALALDLSADIDIMNDSISHLQNRWKNLIDEVHGILGGGDENENENLDIEKTRRIFFGTSGGGP
eukprot:GHVO01032979.1.p2 GENE.GHVO01032979.1~~GHVO01032979.1.p2  ORF type:complete len:142 (+),score=26.77 GHVO01032979.1:47-472(+)